MTALKPFTMPKWGIEMTEGTLAGWQVQEGKPFAKGDVIALIETDKITNEVEAEADGCLVKLVASEQDTLPVGALLGVMGPPDADAGEVEEFVASYKPSGTGSANDDDGYGSAGGEPDSGGEITDHDEPPSPASSASPSERAQANLVTIPDDVAISPAAKRAAEAAGISVDDIQPSGRNGRITRQDVDKAIAGSRSPELKGPIEAPGQEKAFASPLARRIAVQNGVDLSSVEGTGARGRICKADVLKRIDAKQPVAAKEPSKKPQGAGSAGAKEIVPMNSMRRTIAKRLTQAKQDVPHIYLRRKAMAHRLIALRESEGKPGTINDYLIRACALALREVPSVNVQIFEKEIHRFDSADISVAVATDRGLITPIVFAADELSVSDIARTTSALAQKAKSGKLKPEEFQGGSFSISNLGGFGVESFDAIVNPPQGAILAVGKAVPQPVDDNGAIRIVPVLHLSLSCDHRAIDGVDGARFLDALVRLLEQPEQL
ncbi:2-oxo acid dehydrogenase subunit E2 [Aurantiacibacter odishensis]|uniref:2-oxo acid dehydrogenase subunit E2 n=1 Tax=Aurantiacibacter odishensis TaxID=1155476 RepID=UPI000E70BD42|nr:2-oxo acid dehydrogenase subunit E2 [Aurantiacibacter odishensis]